ncbi:uncharacterized protein LOC120527057 [Polypterus senegalus]|uniref:Extracellular matrix phosphoglycoprotein 1 n=1 Tax=Polypterus senegalus TaxID=55291 RepID=A0A250DUV0_POLSE|nr:uncharacterized protein LOC120527057 [Polypterus senegalus]ATA58032.1 extracellular matrix phosphoglycoprotein 1 [Polypterus senegalus]
MRAVVFALCLTTACALSVFHHPYFNSPSDCIEDSGMFYQNQVFQNGFYIYKFVHVYPPGRYFITKGHDSDQEAETSMTENVSEGKEEEQSSETASGDFENTSSK